LLTKDEKLYYISLHYITSNNSSPGKPPFHWRVTKNNYCKILSEYDGRNKYAFFANQQFNTYAMPYKRS